MVNLSPMFLSGVLAPNAEDHLHEPSCPLVQVLAYNREPRSHIPLWVLAAIAEDHLHEPSCPPVQEFKYNGEPRSHIPLRGAASQRWGPLTWAQLSVSPGTQV